MNMGTIVVVPTIQVRPRRGRVLGEVEEYFVQGLVPGDSFVFAGELLRFEGLRETYAEATRGAQGDPKIPAYMGGLRHRESDVTAVAYDLRSGLHQFLPQGSERPMFHRLRQRQGPVMARNGRDSP